MPAGQILDAKSNTILAESADLSSAVLRDGAVGFSVPSGASILRLRLAYSRTLGTIRISGTLDILSVEIRTLPKS